MNIYVVAVRSDDTVSGTDIVWLEKALLKITCHDSLPGGNPEYTTGATSSGRCTVFELLRDKHNELKILVSVHFISSCVAVTQKS